MNRLIRVNAGGRRFEALASTLSKFPGSHLEGAVAAHVQAVEGVDDAGEPPRGRRGRRAPQAPVPVEPEIVLPPAVASRVTTVAGTDGAPELFVDVDPDAFESVLAFLRTGDIRLPTDSEQKRAAVVWQLRLWGLLHEAFPAAPAAPAPAEDPEMAGAGTTNLGAEGGLQDAMAAGAPPAEDRDGDVVELPDVLVVQMCNQMTHDQGVKRHAMTVTYGADGFRLKDMCLTVRKDLRGLLSAAHWQMYQTHERAAFFVCSRINNSTADLLLTSVSQRVVEHSERMGYTLQSSYVTLSPDAVRSSVRLFVHNFIFRRSKLPVLEDEDLAAPAPQGPEDDFGDSYYGDMDGDGGPDGPMPPHGGGGGDAAGGGRGGGDGRFAMEMEDGGMAGAGEEYVPAGYGYAENDAATRDSMYRNFEPPQLGPQMTPPPGAAVPRAQRVKKLWPSDK